MRIATLPAGLLALLLALGPAALAEGAYTREDAKALTIKAVELIQAKGFDSAHAVFEQEGEFKHGELYVNVINQAGIWLVSPPLPSAEGRNVLNVQDATGKHLVQDIIKIANDPGDGWVEYRWMNPETKKIGPKVTYVKRVPGTDLIVYVGIYQ